MCKAPAGHAQQRDAQNASGYYYTTALHGSNPTTSQCPALSDPTRTSKPNAFNAEMVFRTPRSESPVRRMRPSVVIFSSMPIPAMTEAIFERASCRTPEGIMFKAHALTFSARSAAFSARSAAFSAHSVSFSARSLLPVAGFVLRQPALVREGCDCDFHRFVCYRYAINNRTSSWTRVAGFISDQDVRFVLSCLASARSARRMASGV